MEEQLKKLKHAYKWLKAKTKTLDNVFQTQSVKLINLNSDLKEFNGKIFEDVYYPFFYDESDKCEELSQEPISEVPSSASTEAEQIIIMEVFLQHLPIIQKFYELLKNATNQQALTIANQCKELDRAKEAQQQLMETRSV